jgi:hypothetical protein
VALALLALGLGMVLLGLLGTASTANASNHNGKGANQSGPFDPHDVGGGDKQGNGNAPENGTVGKADGKNPPGQLKNNKNRGYECANNKGVGNNGGNPAHSGCAPGTSPTVAPTESTAPSTPIDTLPTESSVPGAQEGAEGDNPEVLGIAKNAPAAVPTAVTAGAGGDGGSGGGLWILLGGALALTGLAIGFAPVTARGKRAL